MTRHLGGHSHWTRGRPGAPFSFFVWPCPPGVRQAAWPRGKGVRRPKPYPFSLFIPVPRRFLDPSPVQALDTFCQPAYVVVKVPRLVRKHDDDQVVGGRPRVAVQAKHLSQQAFDPISPYRRTDPTRDGKAETPVGVFGGHRVEDQRSLPSAYPRPIDAVEVATTSQSVPTGQTEADRCHISRRPGPPGNDHDAGGNGHAWAMVIHGKPGPG